MVFDSGLADLAADLMRSERGAVLPRHVLVKEPGASERTPWHHDEPYYGIDGAQNVSMWIALDPVPATSGLRFIAGSHRVGPAVRARDGSSTTPRTPTISTARPSSSSPTSTPRLDEHRLLSWDVEPGDVIAFHYRTLHDAPGNHLADAAAGR